MQILDLWKNQLDGQLPAWLGSLPLLRHLTLSHNQFTGGIPVELANLENLATLSLGMNQLTGTIPPVLGNLTNLRWFLLDNNALTGTLPPSLANIPGLWVLQVNNNQLTGPIPAAYGSFPELTSLSLSHNLLSGNIPLELGNLGELDWLWVGVNNLTGPIPPELGQLTGLTQLGLRNNHLTGTIPAELGNLMNLTYLTLGTNQLTGPVPVEVAALAGSGSITDFCNFLPPNTGLFIPDVLPYDGYATDGFICDMPLTPAPVGHSIQGTVSYSATAIPGVTVNLFPGPGLGGALLDNTVTDGDGHYSFDGLTPGDYVVRAAPDYPTYFGITVDEVEVESSSVTRNIQIQKLIVLESPSNGATVTTSQPTLTWDPNPEAEDDGSYGVSVYDWFSATWVISNDLVACPPSSAGSCATYAPSSPLQNGAYTWTVKAHDSVGRWVGTTQYDFDFTVDALPTPTPVAIDAIFN